MDLFNILTIKIFKVDSTNNLIKLNLHNRLQRPHKFTIFCIVLKWHWLLMTMLEIRYTVQATLNIMRDFLDSISSTLNSFG